MYDGNSFLSESDHIAHDEQLDRFETRRERKINSDESALLPPKRATSPVQRYRTTLLSPCRDGGRLNLAVNTESGRAVLRCGKCGRVAGRAVQTHGKGEEVNDENR